MTARLITALAVIAALCQLVVQLRDGWTVLGTAAVILAAAAAALGAVRLVMERR